MFSFEENRNVIWELKEWANYARVLCQKSFGVVKCKCL